MLDRRAQLMPSSGVSRIFVVLIFSSLFVSSCRRRTDSVELARLAIQSEARIGDKSHGDSFDARFRTEMEDALAKLDGKTSANLQEPVLALSSFGAAPRAGTGAVSLAIQWVDPKTEATGIFIIAGDGREFSFPKLIRWSDSDLAHARELGWTNAGFPVVLDQSTARAWMGVSTGQSSVHLPAGVLEGGSARVGLFYRNGLKTAPIAILNAPLASDPSQAAPPAPSATTVPAKAD